MCVVLIWNGYSEKWDVLCQGTKAFCQSEYDRHLSYYRTGVKMRMIDDL